MPWSEVSVSVAREQASVAELVLEEQGALAVTLEDDADNPVLEPGPGETPLWPSVHLRGLFEADAGRQQITQALHTVPGLDRPQLINWRVVEDQVWERAWMERFKPMKFGQRLWIVPSGMQIPHDADNIEIQLDPGLAFGTGTHPTTALCLEWMDAQQIAGHRVVDYGCGSGILGIAAALKGAARVICVDNDPQALQATTENAERNHVSALIECHMPDGYSEKAADLVVANILAGPLIALCPLLSGSLKTGGLIVLSGVLEEQADAVIEAYSDLGIDLRQDQLDGWVRLAGRKVA